MNRYRVKDLSNLADVSIKTLHHYDKIGLLKPAFRSEKKYRLYGDYELHRLQQILFYKALGVPLSEISSILDTRNFEQKEALEKHKQKLESEKKKISDLINSIKKSISNLNTKKMLTDKELYEGLSSEEIEKRKKEAKKKYGKENFETSDKYLKSLSKSQFEDLKNEQKEIFKNLLALYNENIESEVVQLEIARHYQNIRKFWGTSGSPSAQKCEYQGLGQLYLSVQEYTKVDDKIYEGFPEFLAEAISYYAKSQLS